MEVFQMIFKERILYYENSEKVSVELFLTQAQVALMKEFAVARVLSESELLLLMLRNEYQYQLEIWGKKFFEDLR
jgi:hypothetical protein